MRRLPPWHDTLFHRITAHPLVTRALARKAHQGARSPVGNLVGRRNRGREPVHEQLTGWVTVRKTVLHELLVRISRLHGHIDKLVTENRKLQHENAALRAQAAENFPVGKIPGDVNTPEGATQWRR